MKLKTLLPILWIAASPAHGQDAAASLRKGEDALASGLWEMAALHFNDSLTHKELPPQEKSHAAVRLAECWVRDGKYAEALDLLGQSFVSSHPEAPFWKGQALAGLGKIAGAIEELSPVAGNPEASLRNEAAFTLANLELALERPTDSLARLAPLTQSSDPALAAKARLMQVEILLDLGKVAEARDTMPPSSDIPPRDQTFGTFLEAHLLLAEGNPAGAGAIFQSLVDQPHGQSPARYHAAALGLADALKAAGSTEAAREFLLTFIQSHPESPELMAFFNRLLDLMPAAPAKTDPVLERIAGWITPAYIPLTGPLAVLPSNAVAAWTDDQFVSTDLLACSLYTRAIGLRRNGTPEAKAEAKRLLTRLRLENPTHPLASRSMFDLAKWAMADGQPDRAFNILDTVRENASSPAMRGEAAFLEARTAWQQGDPEQATLLFDDAAKLLSQSEAKTARFNSALIRLSGSTPILQSAAGDPSLATELELERALSTPEPAARRTAIEDFLTRQPDHPRAGEARLAAAEAALAGSSPDLSFARAQIDTLAANPGKSGELSLQRIALVQLRIQDLAKDTNAAIATARSIIEQFPGDPAAEAALTLGRNLYQTNSYNDARLVLEKLAATDSDPGRVQAAWLLAARSAALVPTTQSQQEALILFGKAIESKGPLAAIAMLEKARLMIDMNRLPEASAFLRKWFDSLSDADPLHLPAGLLLGEAIYAQGSVRQDSLPEALAVYDKLLVHTRKDPAVFNRLQYLRGRTLEQIPEEKDPSKKREKQAFIAYYSVLETDTPPPEWHYFELCGFRALALLEKAGRWPAAVACAKKIAAFKGPRSEEASTRAAQLQLKHMIWED